MGKINLTQVRTIEDVKNAFQQLFGHDLALSNKDTLKTWIAYIVTHTDINVDVVEALLEIAKRVVRNEKEFVEREITNAIIVLSENSEQKEEELKRFKEAFAKATVVISQYMTNDPANDVKWEINLPKEPLHEIYGWAVDILESGVKGKVRLIDCNGNDEILDVRDFAYEVESERGGLFIELSYELNTSWSNAKYYYECNYITEYGDIFELKDALRTLWSSNVGISVEDLLDTPYEDAVDLHKFAEILFEEQPDINAIAIGDRTYIFWNE